MVNKKVKEEEEIDRENGGEIEKIRDEERGGAFTTPWRTSFSL